MASATSERDQNSVINVEWRTLCCCLSSLRRLLSSFFGRLFQRIIHISPSIRESEPNLFRSRAIIHGMGSYGVHDAQPCEEDPPKRQ